jgi:hypothetical protein
MSLTKAERGPPPFSDAVVAHRREPAPPSSASGSPRTAVRAGRATRPRLATMPSRRSWSQAAMSARPYRWPALTTPSLDSGDGEELVRSEWSWYGSTGDEVCSGR